MNEITDLFAWIIYDEAYQEEGIVAQRIGEHWMPLVCSGRKEALVKQMQLSADYLSKTLNKEIRRVRFVRESQ